MRLGGAKVIKPASREPERRAGATDVNLPGQEACWRGGGAQMQVEEVGIRQTVGLLRNGALTFTGQAVRIYARSHFVLLAQNSERASVSLASPAGNLV